MSDRSTPLERLNRAIARPDRGVLGVVDEMLAVAGEHNLRLAWDGDRCWLQVGDEADRVEVALGKSVFRAILARIAALCNYRQLGSVTPYRGEGEIAVDAAGLIRVAFVNMPHELSLELNPARSAVAMGSPKVGETIP